MARLLGISTANYCKKEKGEIKFTLKEAHVVAKFFDKTIEEIFF